MNKNRLKGIALLSVIVIGMSFQSCKKEKDTYYKAMLSNGIAEEGGGDHTITILFYKDGVVQPGDTVKLGASDSVVIGEGSLPGEVEDKEFKSDHFGTVDDSIVVVFDNQWRATHYAKPQADSVIKPKVFYNFDDPHNLWNPRSYPRTKVSSEGHSVNVYNYTFSFHDYQVARKP